MGAQELELYLHIPFCIKKCNYCDFLSMPAEEDVRRHYLGCLKEEIMGKAGYFRERRVPTVFFGGGTPSILAGEQMEDLMDAIRKGFSIEPDAEVTIECNPGTLDEGKLCAYRRAGINRLSLGLQSVRKEELSLLGRIHDFDQFLENFRLARRLGFDNINIDLMSALPGQHVQDWEDTLQRVLALEPEHISAYSLIIEEGTPFYETYQEDERRRERGKEPYILPGEEEERRMYCLTEQLLGEKGYLRYEISNYAKPGRECRHNIGYWRRTPYLGLGLGSASLVGDVRFSNTRDLQEYQRIYQNSTVFKDAVLSAGFGAGCAKALGCQANVLGKQEQMEEFMFLGLRMMEGVSKAGFERAFGVRMETVYGAAIQRLEGQRLLKQEGGRVCLTREGISVSNYVMSLFLLEG